uniref:DUF3326 domain-containing protein n=1 Tax=Timspurckia oligopyrenoides TaxID=708627 RepID=A0A7S1ETB1_9RHOD|mmetsp:Transcript_578/g.1033  ORF Transcript_578/g.1033 Transcript_578/m.1033 type:complete len:424 (+) Transcript_578:64-1335(+)
MEINSSIDAHLGYLGFCGLNSRIFSQFRLKSIDSHSWCTLSPRSNFNTSIVKYSSKCAVFMDKNTDYTAVMIVPTGIGAAIGGFAGDAMPAARLMSKVVDTLITHPNVLNGAQMYWPMENVLYVEGFALDAFASGTMGLIPCRKKSNSIGVVFDAGMSQNLRIRHLQAIDAARATLGIQIKAVATTPRPLDVHLETSASSESASWGTISDVDALLAACRQLIDEHKCNAIAVVGAFNEEEEDEDDLQKYREGEGVDRIGGAEAVISHLVTRELAIPCAHAPALPPLDADEAVSPKAAAEELGYTFLPCVLVGLSRAPQLVRITEQHNPGYGEMIVSSDVDAVVIGSGMMGGAGLLSLAENDDVLVISVEENTSVMHVTAHDVNIKNVVHVKNYLEAAGVIAAHKAGIALNSISAKVDFVQELQ